MTPLRAFRRADISRLNRPDNFIGRVDYAAKVIAARRPTTRAFDNCFENDDPEEVIGVLVNRAERNPRIARNIGFYLTAESIADARTKFAGMSTREIAAQAARTRQRMDEVSQRRREAYLAELEREEISMNMRSGTKTDPWRQSVQTYIGNGHVLPEAEYGFKERQAIENAGNLVVASRPEFFERSDHPLKPDLQILLRRWNAPAQASMLLMSANGEILGGMVAGLPYVKPEHRRNGYGSELIWVTEKLFANRIVWRPGNYSEAGFHARLDAHRLHVERQMMVDSRSVAPWALAQYVVRDGRFYLKQPWTIAEQNAAHEKPAFSTADRAPNSANPLDDPNGGWSEL